MLVISVRVLGEIGLLEVGVQASECVPYHIWMCASIKVRINIEVCALSHWDVCQYWSAVPHHIGIGMRATLGSVPH